MPIFGGSKRPKLDGLTREEERRRDALNPEVHRRAGEQGVMGEAPAAAAILREKIASEPSDRLWPLLLGSQMMSMRRYGQAIDAFLEAAARDESEVRAHYGAGMAYFHAAEYRQEHGAAATDGVAPADMTADNLYQQALRHFRQAMELSPDKTERDELASAVATTERAVARKAGRL
jgi:tetratricopeptide (TPR) repeat protein